MYFTKNNCCGLYQAAWSILLYVRQPLEIFKFKMYFKNIRNINWTLEVYSLGIRRPIKSAKRRLTTSMSIFDILKDLRDFPHGSGAEIEFYFNAQWLITDQISQRQRYSTL